MAVTVVKTVLSIRSPAFEHEGKIPVKYTCEGAGISPPLDIKGVPEDTKSLALIMEDPDAPKGVFDHWVIWNIPPVDMIPENTSPGLEGINSAGKIGYTGPCPPSDTHRYFFKLYAVDMLLDIAKGANKTKLLFVLQKHVLAYGELIGLYEKQK